MEMQEKSLFSKELIAHIERLTNGNPGVCVTCGIMHDTVCEFKMWNDVGEQAYKSQFYEIGSITKTFTGLLMSQAVLSGKASADDSISKWIPELDQEKFWPPIKRLLTHTSGIPEDDESVYDLHEVEERNLLFCTREELVQKLNALTLENKRYPSAYSNVACATIGLVLERIYGKSYKELITGLFDQFGLHKMIAYPTENTGLYGIGQDNRQCENWKWTKDNAMAPAGSITSTPEDLMKYGSIILNHASKDIQLATTPIDLYSKEGEEPEIKVGYFWMCIPEYQILFHNGGTGCFNSALVIDVKAKTVMIFLSNKYLKEDALFTISELLRLRKAA